MFRADSTLYAGDRFRKANRHLRCAQISKFQKWWSKHEVVRRLLNQKQIQHPIDGHMELVICTSLDGENHCQAGYACFTRKHYAEQTLARSAEIGFL